MNEAIAIAKSATAHNSGQTVYECYEHEGRYRILMSSWPRAREAIAAFREQDWNAEFGPNHLGQWIEAWK
jgi:hypothetical protein